MKTMTCRQLGGPCDQPHRAATADEIIQAQDTHLKESVGAGDESHGAAAADMRARWERPQEGMGWYQQTQEAFAALPED